MVSIINIEFFFVGLALSISTLKLQRNYRTTEDKSAPSVALAFTCQGAQSPGMGKQLLDKCPFARNEVRHLDQIAQNLGFPSPLPVLQSDEVDIRKLAPATVQLASVLLQIALSKLWASWNIHPSYCCGESSFRHGYYLSGGHKGSVAGAKV